MPNIVRVTVENPDELLDPGMYGAGAVIRLDSAATEAGPYSAVTTTPILVDTRLYTLYDATGTTGTWYRVRYEASGGSPASEYGSPFQVLDENAGLLCSLYDVEQRLSGVATPNDRELLLEFIRGQSVEVAGYTKRAFNPFAGTFRLDVGDNLADGDRTLWIDRGVRSITALRIATSDQPDTGGTFTTVDAEDVVLRPVLLEREPGWPATRIVLLRGRFTRGINTVEVEGAFGFAAVPRDVAQVVENAVIRRFVARGSGVSTAFGTEEFGARVLRWVSPEEREVLDRYRIAWAG